MALSVNQSQLSLTEKQIIAALVVDVAALRTAIIAVNAKLDADAGVTDTNYGTLTNPVAATLTA